MAKPIPHSDWFLGLVAASTHLHVSTFSPVLLPDHSRCFLVTLNSLSGFLPAQSPPAVQGETSTSAGHCLRCRWPSAG